MNRLRRPTTSQAAGPGRETPERPRSERIRVGRVLVRAGGLCVALLAAFIVSSLTIDLGPYMRGLAEREGSKRLERPIRIGRLSIRLATGQFVLDDVVIGGLRPGDRPFLRAKQIAVGTNWAALLRREILIETVALRDWQMLVETFEDGGHTFPRFVRGGPAPRSKPYVATVKLVRAVNGEFTYDDHGTPWSVVARHIDLTMRKLDDYRGEVSFRDGTVRIRRFEPFQADMRATFHLVGGTVVFDRMELVTERARTMITGETHLTRWPEQVYNFRSTVDLPWMKAVFFAGERFTLEGTGAIDGRFRIFRGGRELTGTFASDLVRLNRVEFPNVGGSLMWLRDRFEVRNARADFYGGSTRFSFAMRDMGRSAPGRARLDVAYDGVNLAALTDSLETSGLRLLGRASGRNVLEWPIGRFAGHQGDGEVRVEPPAGVVLLEPDAAKVGPIEAPGSSELRDYRAPLGYVPVGGRVSYAYGPEWVRIGPSELATETSHVRFQGETAYGERSRIPFDVVSSDWQESDRLLAAVLTALGSPTRAVEVGGRGEFHGVMLESFARPRIEGRFEAKGLRAWDVAWGDGSGAVVIQNGYVDVTDGIVRKGGSEIHANGRFSLGYPRRDGGEEINARIRVVRRPVADLRHAFELDGYRVEGILSGEYHLYGAYARPHGFGLTLIEQGVAYGEPFERASASLRFEGPGIRFDGIDIRKGGQSVTGAAYIGLNGTYSFEADARALPLESLALASDPRVPLVGTVRFAASGRGTFDTPRYEVRFQVGDLFLKDEGVGQVVGSLQVRDGVLTCELEAASPRLSASGVGRIALGPGHDADLTFRFTRTSLDPYVRAFDPRVSPFATAVASGTVRVAGPLDDRSRLAMEATIDALELGLFDYRLTNDGRLRLSLRDETLTLEGWPPEGRASRPARLVGLDTRLDLAGAYELATGQVRLRAEGDANLGVLQAFRFFKDLTSSGRAALVASVRGTVAEPVFAGRATITDGRIRHFSLPHAVDRINGEITFAADGIQLNDVTGTVGGGEVTFGGRIGLKGFVPGEFDITATGERMVVRFPEGFRSQIDADLALRGTPDSLVLSGTVNVRDAVYTRRLALEGGLLEIRGAGATPAPPSAAPWLPLRFDLRILAPSALRVENDDMRVVSSADLNLRGTYEAPQLFGRADIERGLVLFEGRRYLVTVGTIEFLNPARIEPSFDIEAETLVRVPGQTYRVTLRATGTVDRMDVNLTSDPPLPTADILALVLGDVRATRDAELRALQDPTLLQQDILRTRATRLLTGPITSEVGRVVEQTFGVDTFQLTPSLVDPYQQSTRINPSARLTIGKRISDRAYLTFSRSLTSTTRDQIILLEYDQSDRVSWIFTQNEDRTYSLDIRIRRVF